MPALDVRRSPAVRPLQALAHVLFRARSGFHAAGDRVTALSERLPGAGQAPSTLVAYGAVGLLAAILVADLIGPTPAESSVEPPPALRPVWIEMPGAHGSFALEFPAFGGPAERYEVSRHREGGGRKDELTWGSAGERGHYARVTLYRPGTEGEAPADAFAAVVRLAAQSGVDAELRDMGASLDTKFGPLAVIDMTVTGREGPRACLAAARGWRAPRFGLVAWWCNDGPEIVAHGNLACLLDRLALMSAGGDQRLAEFFAAAELRRGYCGKRSTWLAPTPQRPHDWISTRTEPRLRGRLGWH